MRPRHRTYPRRRPTPRPFVPEITATATPATIEITINRAADRARLAAALHDYLISLDDEAGMEPF